MAWVQRIRAHIFAVFQNLGTLTLLAIAFPVSFSVVFASLLWSYFRGLFQKKAESLSGGNLRSELSKRVEQVENPKNILLTGGRMTKALLLARSFRAAGHKVFLVETKNYWLAGNQYSNSVSRFYTVPAPQHDPDGYTQALLDIVKKDNIDIFIPVSTAVASLYDSLAAPVLSRRCEVFHFDADITKMLDDKLAFSEKARSLGLPAPKTFLITDPEQVLKFDFEADGSQYILKSIAYDSIHRLALVKLPFRSTEEMAAYVYSLPISKDNPWIMQEFITGQEYCTHSTVRDGVLRLHCCSNSSAFQVNYEQVEHPQILQWVSHFVKELNLTGQISFDFIEQKDGTVYAIECNPRVHSAITMFHDQPKAVADAYLERSSQALPPVQPLPDSKPTYWLFHELWRFTNVRSWHDLQERLKIIERGTDAVFTVSDPLPFLGVNHWQIPLLILNSMRRLKGWERIDFNIGKLVQVGGD